MNEVMGHVAVISTSYKWTIPNFSKYDTISIEFIKSPIFWFEKNNVRFEWQLSLNAISNYLFLNIRSHNKEEIKLTVKLSILDYNNEEIQQCMNSFTFTKKKNTFATNVSVGRNEIPNEQNGVLKDGQLTIKCELMADCTWCQEIESAILSKRHEQLDCLEKLLDNEKFSDVEIVVDEGRTLHAHKILLACKSATFASMFDGEENKNCCRITVTDVKYEACKEMLRFIYVGKVKDLDKLVYQLTAVADKYSIGGLKNLCEAFLCKNIALGSMVRSLHLASQYNMSILKDNLVTFIVKNRKLVIKEPDFMLLGSLLPAKLIFELFCAVVNVDE